MIDASGAHAMHLLDPAKDGEVQRLIDAQWCAVPAGA